MARDDNQNKSTSTNSGIYQIQSITHPERVYVGSAINLRKRRYDHLYLLRRNSHENAILQNHYNKYGENDLVFEVIETGDYFNKNHLLSREQGWFDHFSFKKRNKPYFNICSVAGSSLGCKQSDECKQKVSNANKGRKHTEEARRNMGNAGKGRIFSQEHRLKISKALKGKPKSDKARGNMSKSAKGKVVSEETRRKKSIKTRGIPHSDEHNHKVSIAITEWWRKKREQDCEVKKLDNGQKEKRE